MIRVPHIFSKTQKIATIICKEEKLATNKNNVLLSSWGDLRGKKILNENILICGFGDIHPFTNNPIFTNAKNIYLHNNYKYFHYYWINKTVFPTLPNIILNGHPCDSPVLDRGFTMYLTPYYFHTAIRYANEIGANISLLHKIENEDFDKFIDNFESEKVILENNDQSSPYIKKPTLADVSKSGDIISKSIMEKAGW